MTEKLRQAAQQALKALENVRDYRIEESLYDDITALRNALAEPEQKPVALDQIEQYRLQMAAISTAAMGYWKKGDGILPDYDTPALRDVADLYAKYELLVAQPEQKPVTAQHRFRHPEKTIPDWSEWQECKVSNRPAWEIDSRGYEVEYRNLYTAPPEQKRREWQGITNEEIMDVCSAVWASGAHPIEVGRIIEAKLKEKNT